MQHDIEVGIIMFLSGSTIDEVRNVWGFGRNKTIQILKDELGTLKYEEAARKTRIQRGTSACKKANKGKKRGPQSEEHKQKISKSQLGKEIDAETRKKISESLKKRIKEIGPLRTPESIAKAAQKARQTKLDNGAYEIFSKKMTGRRRAPHSEQTKERMSQLKLDFYARGGTNWIKGKTHSPVTLEKLSANTKRLWQEGKFDNKNGLWRSQLEKDVFERLCRSYECQHSFRVNTKVYDIFVVKLNLLIEIQRDYWHYNPSLYSGDYFDVSRNLKVQDVWRKDEEKAINAISSGYEYCQIWQKDLIENFSKVIDDAISKFTGEDRQWETNSPN